VNDDDPEKRIRELERGLADATQVAHAPIYHAGFATPPRRIRPRLPYLAIGAVALAIVLPIAMAIVWGVNRVRNSPANVNGGGTTAAAPITLEHGGTFTLGGNGSTDTIACNDGNLTLNSNNSTVNVTGHCASLKLSGFNNHLNIDSADAIEVSGFGNTITETACNDGKLIFSGYNTTLTASGHCAILTLSSYGNRVKVDAVDTVVVSNFSNRLSVAGHGKSLTVSAYDNQVQFDSVDTIVVSGYNNTVTFHTGSPKVTQAGRNNTVKKG
jgi:Protein of unknown function (DUF3060)